MQQATHKFQGRWITNEEFYRLPPRNVFHRQLEKTEFDCSQHRNRHILFRKKFLCREAIKQAKIFISADDYYKLYINGRFAAQGPAAANHFRYNYNEIGVTGFVVPGENTIAVHTLYQGIINRVWQSGDNRHGLIFDLEIDGRICVFSDESFRTAVHSAYTELGTAGYDTNFLEEYDARAAEVGFEKPDYDDSYWRQAKISETADHVLLPQQTEMLAFEKIFPVSAELQGDSVVYDFGSNYCGYLVAEVYGSRGDAVVVRAGQELNEDGSVRYRLRANCAYEERWILSGGKCMLDQYDYKSFRYAQLIMPEGCRTGEVYLLARHYPFRLSAKIKREYSQNEQLQKIWELCVHTQEYGVQEAVLDCMEREKGFYVGDGCYTALAHMILTGKDDMARKLIDDAFATECIADTLMTCLGCSLMQEIAEYPLILVKLVLWHYRFTGDCDYLAANYPKVLKLLESYRRDYEKELLLGGLDKWCVVEWPANFRDGYDVDLEEGKICQTPHVSINAYYIEAVAAASAMASILGRPAYRDVSALREAFVRAFYLPEKHLFKDSILSDHVSMPGNIFPFAYGLCPDGQCEENILRMIKERGIRSVSFFCGFPLLEGLVRCGRQELLYEMLSDRGAWLRMLAEGATTTFEGWGKDTKWNTSLFHLTLSYAAVFLADIDLNRLFR